MFNQSLLNYLPAGLQAKAKVSYVRETSRGTFNFGHTMTMFLDGLKIKDEQSMFSWETERRGVSLQLNKSADERKGAIPTAYFFQKFTSTDLLLKAEVSNTPVGKFSLPFRLSMIMHNKVGDNLLIKSESDFSQNGGSSSYFGYSYSPNLHVGVALKQIPKQEGSREQGFLDKSYAAGFEVHYQH